MRADEFALRGLIVLMVCAAVWLEQKLRRHAAERKRKEEDRRLEDERWLNMEWEEPAVDEVRMRDNGDRVNMTARGVYMGGGGGCCDSVTTVLGPGSVYDLPGLERKCERCGAKLAVRDNAVTLEWQQGCSRNRVEAHLCKECAVEVRNAMLKAWGNAMSNERRNEE